MATMLKVSQPSKFCQPVETRQDWRLHTAKQRLFLKHPLPYVDSDRYSLKKNLTWKQSDGPVGLAAAMDTYRVNRYNITQPTNHTNRLIQGGFRYQKLALHTPGELVLADVGVKPTTSTTPLSSLPGSFECSDEALTLIWQTGARTIQLNEIPALPEGQEQHCNLQSDEEERVVSDRVVVEFRVNCGWSIPRLSGY